MNLHDLVRAAIDEDLGPGCLTTLNCIGEGPGVGRIFAKQDLTVCGNEPARRVFEEVARRLGGDVVYTVVSEDGARVTRGTDVCRIEAPQRVLLIGERVALNWMMKLSGIATNVRSFVDAAGVGGPRVVDTRKTTPLHRALEKHAVRCGGGHNHRFALYDGVMVKDNHISAVGSLSAAVQRVRENVHHLVRIEVEVTNEAELREALATDADVILLDNMDDERLASAVAIARATRPSVILEASGNITAPRVRGIVEKGIGVDVVSSGGLIHQATWVDLSMDVQPA